MADERERGVGGRKDGKKKLVTPHASVKQGLEATGIFKLEMFT